MGHLGQLDTEAFARLIETLGEVPSAFFQKVGPCPNPAHMDPVGGLVKTLGSCPLCGGSGEVFKAMPLPLYGATGGKVVCQQAMVGNRRLPIEIQGGELICSFIETEYPFHDGDRIALSTRSETHSQTYERDTTDPTDRLLYSPVIKILTVYRGDSLTEVTAGFEPAADGMGITWTVQPPPPKGTLITLVYEYNTSWAVLGASRHRRVRATDGSVFPSRVLMSKWLQRDTDAAPGFV
jgi:hypothetical protein